MAPIIAGTEYAIPVAPGHTVPGPVIEPADAPLTETDLQRGALAPQEKLAVTQTLPATGATPISTVMIRVPWPPTILKPAGVTQVYEIAPERG